jgi:hypothetical protein
MVPSVEESIPETPEEEKAARVGVGLDRSCSLGEVTGGPCR